MPVEFICPSCGVRIEQTLTNRMLPKIECAKCKQFFRTQWASSDSDLALLRGPAVSERFESGRNFANKIWNATRFVLMNMDGFAGGPLDMREAPLEDRWLASRLASVTRDVTAAIDDYRFAEASRVLYAFVWDQFCSAYVELCKSRLADPLLRDRARTMLLLGLDTILRLLHPMMPFVTEELWQHLGEAVGQRCMPWDSGTGLAESIMIARWPEPDAAWIDERTETQFGTFLGVVAAIREIRSRQNVPPRTTLKVAVCSSQKTINLLEPMRAAIESMAAVEIHAMGSTVQGFPGASSGVTGECEVFVDLADFVDVGTEIARIQKENEKLSGFIKAKKAKLSDEKFAARAPQAVVEKERQQLAEYEATLAKGVLALSDLLSRKAL